MRSGRTGPEIRKQNTYGKRGSFPCRLPDAWHEEGEPHVRQESVYGTNISLIQETGEPEA